MPSACVTGGNGFLASALIRQLLEKGYAVNATVRDPGNEQKAGQLKQMQSLGTLTIFRADLEEEGSFDEAFNGCDYVFLVAAPVKIMSENPEGYAVSKVLAEKEAIKYAEENELSLVRVIPSLIVGPAVGSVLANSTQLSLCLLSGNEGMIRGFRQMQCLSGSISMVHVEDLCRAHIFVAEEKVAAGRYICSAVNTSLPELACFLRMRYPQRRLTTDKLEDIYDETIRSAEAVGFLTPTANGSTHVQIGDSCALDDENFRNARREAEHYSVRISQTLEEREARPIVHLRKLNDWVGSPELQCSDMVTWEKLKASQFATGTCLSA
ncbi:hypothetical protein ZIOFF_058068 [Zingiber officinale]|uniref:NAD(P)-binding domain-containing protein n=1 Tax=Zingiber officinale TaxID=94328 RepID=A0A8J5FDH3_ZINOF|nr:hypothetical protein ZIOFF_058068 [Zingiber officinale]